MHYSPTGLYKRSHTFNKYSNTEENTITASLNVKHNKYTVTTKNVAEDKVRLSLRRSFKCPFHTFTAFVFVF